MIAKIAGNGYAKPLGTPFPATVGYDSEKVEGQTYDADKAADLLLEAGYQDSDGNGFVERTLDRSRLFSIQTPQVFAAPLILEAYRLLTLHQEELVRAGVHITDDAMVVESMLKHPVKLVEASGGNIKITTPEDMELAEFLASRIARCEK